MPAHPYDPSAPVFMALIDGTGEDDNAAYAASMAGSFCKQLESLPGSSYWRGPTSLGKEVGDLAKYAAQWLQLCKERRPEARLMIAGYSRGGSAAILAAEHLQRLGMEIDSLFLFDAVARHGFDGGEVIPENVRFSRHARRSQAPLFVWKYEGTVSDHWALGSTSNPTRPMFGNTGVSWRGDGDHQQRVFTGTHGALGGVGWRFVEEDDPCQSDVATWMNEALVARGLKGILQNKGLGGPDGRRAGVRTRVMGSVLDLWLLAYQKLEQRHAGQR